MSDYISREELTRQMIEQRDAGISGGKRMIAWNTAIRLAQNTPAADVAPVVRGEWVMLNDGLGIYSCTKCGRLESHKWDYCRCGARMHTKEYDDAKKKEEQAND